MSERMVTDHYTSRLSDLDLEMIQAVPQGGNWRDIPEHIKSRRLAQIRKNAANGGGSRSTYYGRLRWDAPAYTISTYFNRPGNGCFIHPATERLISIREAARLQSFPDSYRFYGSARQRQAQVGNAVPPLLAYHLAHMFPAGRYLDLFCGAGGISLGLDWAGLRCVGAIDHDKASLETFARNRVDEEVTIQADLGAEEGYTDLLRTIRNRLGHERLDLLVGGPPCQGFSTAGNNLRDDPRNRLIWAFVRFVEDLYPWSVLIENVPALAWNRNRHVLARIRRQLGFLGYATDYVVAHAEGYGVPQLRRRLFLIASRGNEPISWPVPSHRILKPAYLTYQPRLDTTGGEGDRQPYTTCDAIADLPEHTTPSPDDTTSYVREPSSEYGRWARGMTSLHDLLPNGGVIRLQKALTLI